MGRQEGRPSVRAWLVESEPVELPANADLVATQFSGAFTPTCTVNHLPGFLENLPKLKEKGVQTVAVIASNDPFVMSAWGKANQVKGDDVVCRRHCVGMFLQLHLR